MPSKQHKAALEDEKSKIEHEIHEVSRKIQQLQLQTELTLREKIELEMKLKIIEEGLNLYSASGKSIAFAPNSKFSCQSKSQCTMCRHAVGGAETPEISSLIPHSCASIAYCNECQQLFNQDNQSTKISSPLSSIINKQSLQHSSVHTKITFNQQSCQSIGNCSLCRKFFVKPGTSCTSPNCEQCSKVTFAEKSCKSLAQCSLCKRTFMEPSVTILESCELHVDPIFESIKSKNLSHSRKASDETLKAHPSCKSIGNCNICRKLFATPSDSLKSCNETESKAKIAPSCKSLGQCSLCQKTYLSSKVFGTEKASSELSLCEDCSKSVLAISEANLKQIHLEPSCKSLANCSVCQKAFEEFSKKASGLSNEPLCEDCEILMSRVHSQIKPDQSCKSIAHCSLCHKFFSESKASKISKAKSGHSICDDCDKSTINIDEKIHFQQSCKSLANCSLCQKAFEELSTKTSNGPIYDNIEASPEVSTNEKVHFEASCKSLATCSVCQKEFKELSEKASEIPICIDCESSIISEKENQEKVQTQPSCKSLAQCSVCQKAFTELSTKLSEVPICDDCEVSQKVSKLRPDASCKSLANCDLCKKAYLETKASEMTKAKSGISVCDDCNKLTMTDNESQFIMSSIEVIQAEASCKSLAQCSVCQKAYTGSLEDGSEPLCENCKESKLSLHKEDSEKDIKVQQSCKSLAQCSLCLKAFTGALENESEPVCDECHESKISLNKKESEITETQVTVQQSCKSLAQCSICQKAFNELSEGQEVSICDDCREEDAKKVSAVTLNAQKSSKSLAECRLCKKEFEDENQQISDKSKSPVCTDCRESIISQFETQLSKVFKPDLELEPEEKDTESDMSEIEPDMKEIKPNMKEISVYTMKIDPSCKSLGQCSVCQKAFVADKGEPPMANISNWDCTSFSMCALCAKMPKKSKEDLSKFNPVGDIVHSIYYSTTSIPADAKIQKSGKNTPTSKRSEETIKSVKKKGLQASQEPEMTEAELPKSKKKQIDDEFCPKKIDIKEPELTASELLEKNLAERAKKEEKRKSCDKQEAVKILQEFLQKEKENELKASEPSQNEDTCPNDPGSQECFYDNECAKFDSEPNLGEPKKTEKIEYSKMYLKYKYLIEMQNYKISKLSQELKLLKQRGLHAQMGRVKEQLRKEMKKLRALSERSQVVQKQDSEGTWGSIPYSTISLTQLENTSYDFDRVIMPDKPTEISISDDFVKDIEDDLEAKEREHLIKLEEVRAYGERIECIYEKTKELENIIFALKMENENLKMKEKYFDSVIEDSNPDKKHDDAKELIENLQEKLTKMKDQFDEIHKNIHDSVKAQ